MNQAIKDNRPTLRNVKPVQKIDFASFKNESFLTSAFGTEMLDMYVSKRNSGSDPFMAFCSSFGSVVGECEDPGFVQGAVCLAAGMVDGTDYVQSRLTGAVK